MSSIETITMIRQTIESFIKRCGGSVPSIAIYPFGKDGLYVKYILNNQFGIKEKYIADNSLCELNKEILSGSELLMKGEKLAVIVSTAAPEINDHICEEIRASGNENIQIVNITDPIIQSFTSDKYYRELKELLQIKSVKGHPFIRVGRLNDGGYVMIDDFTSEMKAYSIGIGNDMSWDAHINEMTGMRVNMYDHTVPCAPGFNRNCHFNKIGLGTIDDEEHNLLTLNTILEKNDDNICPGNLILKMDIEGAEWDVLDSVPESVLNCFRQMVFELHGMTDDSENGRKKILRVLKKLNATHQVVWVHGNNCTYAVSDNEMTIPYAIEVLYVKRDCYDFTNEGINLPLSIDMPNMTGRKDFDLSFLV